MKQFLFILILFISFSQITNPGNNSFASETPYIPDSIGSVENSYECGADKTVILIKDAHSFSEAQFNIAQIIRRLAQYHGIRLIGVEGAAGQLSIDAFRDIPFPQAKNAVAHDYLKKGVLSGA